MPPPPTEDVDLQILWDKILDLLRALWTFVRDFCITLWSYVTQTFWNVWTYPPFEAFRSEFVAALITLMDYVAAHPLTAAAIFILAFIIIPTVLNMVFITLRITFMHCLGCNSRERSVLHGSYPANYQSTSYGDNVPRNSTFVRPRSQGTKGRGGYRVVGATGSTS